MTATHTLKVVAGRLDAERRQCVANDQLFLIPMPTEACNFRCTYCYEDFRYRRMEPWVVEAMKRFMSIRAPALRLLEINWFGGEPLTASDIVEDVSRHVQQLLHEHPGMRAKCGMTTNAYLLTAERFRRLLDLGVREYQIAFDGPREWHDRKRVRANGGATFDRVWGNLLATRQAEGPFRIIVRLHVARDNHAACPAFIRDFAKELGADSRYELFIRTLSRLGGPNDACLPVFEEAEGREAVRGLSRLATELGVRHLTIEQHTPVCYAARGNSYVVRANGRLNKCTVALEHPANQVGMLRADGRVDVAAARLQPWMRGFWSGDREELECPMRGLAEPGNEGRRETGT